MHYLRIGHLEAGMVLAKSIIGDNGSVLLRDGNQITANILKRMIDMGFQGAYIENPHFSDIIVEDIIDDDIRLKAFLALSNGDFQGAASIAKSIVKQLKYKQVLKLDLLDIKNDKNYVFKHSISVSIFSTVLGIGCGMNEEQLENLAIAGLLHDIGKLEIKKRVLNCKSVYNEKQLDEMKKHPALAYESLKDFPGISSVSRNAILFHHENIDGSGYYQIPGDKLGIFPRILRVADTYDALTAAKKYREASSPADAIEYIMSNVDKKFDKDIVDIFVKDFPIYPVGFTVRLSNGIKAVVISNENNSMRPKIRLFDGSDIDLSSDKDYRSVLIEEII